VVALFRTESLEGRETFLDRRLVVGRVSGGQNEQDTELEGGGERATIQRHAGLLLQR
jgi:hypothetical protein